MNILRQLNCKLNGLFIINQIDTSKLINYANLELIHPFILVQLHYMPSGVHDKLGVD